MSAPTQSRRPVEAPLDNSMRKLAREVERERAAAERHRRNAEAASAALYERWHREWKRFGRDDIPRDPFILDVLASVVVEPGDRWIWRGHTNNHGLPTVRCPYVPGSPGVVGSERSVVRVLAEAFGVVAPETNGVLYPLNGRDDVNPFHRRLRLGSNTRMGNPHRHHQDGTA